MKRLFYTTLVFLALSSMSAADGNTELSISTGNYAPFTDETAPNQGLVNQRITQIASAAGYTVKFDYLPWMRALELARTGKYAASSYWYFSAERQADFFHVGPVLYDELVFITRQDQVFPDWTELTELSALTFGAVPGYTYTEEFWRLSEAGEITVETAQSDESNLRKLLAGRIDAYPMSGEGGSYLIEQLFSPEDRARFTFQQKPLIVTEGYLLVSRQSDGAEEVARALQDALDNLNF